MGLKGSSIYRYFRRGVIVENNVNRQLLDGRPVIVHSARERRESPAAEIKIHRGSSITIHLDEDRQVSFTVEEIESPIPHHWLLKGREVNEGDWIEVVVTQ